MSRFAEATADGFVIGGKILQSADAPVSRRDYKGQFGVLQEAQSLVLRGQGMWYLQGLPRREIQGHS
jgi:hypothetical protein